MALLGAMPIANATTVTFGAVPTARTVTAADGVTTITSGLVMVGTFANEAFTFIPGVSTFATISLAGSWERLGVDTVTDTTNSGVTLPGLTINGTGKVGTSITDNNFGPTKADFFNTKPLYLWIFDAATVNSATQMGIFRATSASVPWAFTSNAGGATDSVTYSTTQSGAPTIVATGGVGSVGTAGNGTLQLVTVPEPSVLALGGMAALGMLASRKRGMKK